MKLSLTPFCYSDYPLLGRFPTPPSTNLVSEHENRYLKNNEKREKKGYREDGVFHPAYLNSVSRYIWISSQRLEEEGENAVAGEVGEGGEFEGVVAAGEFEGTRVGAVAAEGGE